MIHNQEAIECPVGTITKLDTSERSTVYLVECFNGAQIRISEIALRLLQWRWSGIEQSDVARRLNELIDPPVSDEEALKYVADLENKIAALAEKKRAGEPEFGFKLTLFDASTTARVSGLLLWMFSPLAAIIGVTLIGAGAAAWILEPPGRQALTPSTAAIAYALFLASLFFHEFGHSTACLRFGGKCGKIGFTIYLIFPSFFSDVRSAWAFQRWQRVVVDVAGSYFQCVVGGILAILGVVTHFYPFYYATLLIAFTTLFNLNPIFKFDGYWMLGDAIGVTNLSKQPKRIINAVVCRMLGKKHETLPFSAAIISVLVLYSVITSSTWAAFLVHLALSIFREPQELYSTFLGTKYAHFGWTQAGQFAGTLLGLFLTVYLAFRWARGVRSWVLTLWRGRIDVR